MTTKSTEIIVIENDSAIDTKNLNKAEGIDETDQEHEDVDMAADFRLECAKFWPFRAMKIANWILLLFLAIGAVIAEKYPIYWADAWQAYNARFMPRSISIIHVLFWVFTSIAMMASGCSKSLLSIVEVSVMNVCIWTLSIPMLLINLLVLSIKSVAEYRWFVPRIVHYYNNATEDGLRELTESYKLTRRLYYSDEQWQENIQFWQDYMAERKFAIFLNLAIDPAITILELLALLTSIYLITYMIKMMRRCKVWAPRSEDYKSRHPECSTLEQQYSKLGVLKTVQWLFPVLSFSIIIYLGMLYPRINEFLGDYFKLLVLMLGPITIVCFPLWLSFICKVNLRRKKNEKLPGLMCIFFWDVILCACIALSFIRYLKPSITSEWAGKCDFIFYIAGTLLYGGSLAMNVWLLWKNRINLRWNPPKLPQLPVYVKFTVEVGRRDVPNNKPKYEKDEKQMECLLGDE